MKWIDAYEATRRWHGGRMPTEAESTQLDTRIPGVVFRPEDGTRGGAWRVTRSVLSRHGLDGEVRRKNGVTVSPDINVRRDGATWSLWDFRDYPRSPPSLVVAGLPSAEVGMRVGDAFAGSRILRTAHAVTSGVVRIVREVVREWRTE